MVLGILFRILLAHTVESLLMYASASMRSLDRLDDALLAFFAYITNRIWVFKSKVSGFFTHYDG